MVYFRNSTLLFLLATMLLLVACGGNSALEDVPWKLVAYGEPDNPVPALTDRVSVITFESQNHSFGGNTGCNAFGGDYELDGDELTVTGPIFHTEMACGLESAEQERQVLEVLQAADFYEVEGDRLTITSPDGILVYEKQTGE